MTYKLEKQMVSRRIDSVDPNYLELPLDQLLTTVRKLIDVHGKDAKLTWHPFFYYDYDDKPSPKFFVEMEELESDDEFNQRCAALAAADRVDLENEQAEFARLQRKFALK